MPSRFEQPEIPDRDHQSAEIDSELFDSISTQFLGATIVKTTPQAGCFSSLSSFVMRSMEEENGRIAGYPIEHLPFFDHDGSIVREYEGTDSMVSFEFDPLIFRKPCMHNHPNGSPPSRKDVFAMAAFEFPLVRVVTPDGFLFDIGPGGNRSISDLKFAYEHLDSVSWGVAEDCIRSHGLNISEEERFFRRQHSLLHELARRDLLCYGHRRWRV